MGFKPPKPPQIPKPVTIDKSKIENDADIMARRLSLRKGYASSIATSPSGAPNFGANAAVPGLAPGGSPTLGSGQ
jgi:hypothetical protein